MQRHGSPLPAPRQLARAGLLIERLQETPLPRSQTKPKTGVGELPGLLDTLRRQACRQLPVARGAEEAATRSSATCLHTLMRRAADHAATSRVMATIDGRGGTRRTASKSAQRAPGVVEGRESSYPPGRWMATNKVLLSGAASKQHFPVDRSAGVQRLMRTVAAFAARR